MDTTARRIGGLVFPRGRDLHTMTGRVGARTLLEAEDEALEASRLQLRDHAARRAARAAALRRARV